MTVSRRVSMIIGTVVAVLGLGAGVAFAANNDSVVSGTTDHSIYKTGRTVTVTGTVNGDIFCAAQTVDIDAVVNGDVICAGQTVTVNGTVRGNVRIAGQTVNVGADVQRSVSLAGQDATLQSNARVGSDVSVAAQTGTIDSFVGRDVHGAGHTLVLNSRVGRDVESTGERLQLESQADIGGNVTYTGPDRLKQIPGVRIAGSVIYHRTEAGRQRHINWGRIWIIKSIYVSLALLVLSMVLVAIFPQLFARWNKPAVAKSWWASMVTGFVAMFVVPAVIIGLTITLVGIPLAGFVTLAWMLAWLLSAPITAFYVGSLLPMKDKRAPLVMLAGSVILAVLCMIPILGIFVTIAAAWFGTGRLLLNLRGLYQKPQYKI